MVTTEDIFDYDYEDDHISSMGADTGSLAATAVALSGTIISLIAAVEILYVYGVAGDAEGINCALYGPNTKAVLLKNKLSALKTNLTAAGNDTVSTRTDTESIKTIATSVTN